MTAPLTGLDPVSASGPATSGPEGHDGDRFGLFADRAGALGVTVTRVATVAGAAETIWGLAREGDHRTVIVAAGVTVALPGLDAALAGHGIEVDPAGDAARTRDAPLGISWAATAIAETGSVLLAEPTLDDRAVGMLVATHVVLCPAAGLRATLEDAADALRAIARQPGGSYATLVTGPSRTADIERVLTVGVQGPSRVVVIFIDEP
ncbi:MAG: lactate utilization protein [Chloroflexia bacterium]|nr:lactate utilization protein [Chloroflexia bacterium]